MIYNTYRIAGGPERPDDEKGRHCRCAERIMSPSMKKKNSETSTKNDRPVLAFFIWLIARLLTLTLRFITLGEEKWRALSAAGKQLLSVTWHGRQFMLHGYNHDLEIVVMSSASRDGRLQAAILKRFGIRTVEGSSSRGGARALVALIREIRQGRHSLITTDGPRGPIYKVKPGICLLAKKTGGVIIPVVSSAKWKITLKKTWDQFQIPMPFSKVVIMFGNPIQVDKSATAAELENTRIDLETEMHRLLQEADAYFSS